MIPAFVTSTSYPAVQVYTSSNVSVADMEDLQPFAYSTLSAREIRLLVPDGSGPATGLSWSLRTFDIDDKDVHFTSLSYVWAAQTHPDMFPVACNGCRLQVHQNLYTALPFLARRFVAEAPLAVPFWIDAICINQADDEEKISQIRLMNTIYRRADRVLVWLGLTFVPEVQDWIPRAIELLPVVIEESKRCRKSPVKNNFEVPRELSHLGREGWEAILHLLRNPYFRRLWMVQEVALAKAVTFLCGEHEISLDLMEQAVVDSWQIHNWIIYDLTNMGRMRLMGQSHDDSMVFSIRSIVQNDCRFHKSETNAHHRTIRIANLLDDQACFAPQDRVLGILGMVQEEFGDSGKDLHTYTSIPDLYTRFSILMFEASGPAVTETHWWYYVSMAFSKNRIQGLPSWVPDLHHRDAQSKRRPWESMLGARVYSDPPWQASSKACVASKGSQPDEIILRGKILDEVKLVHPEIPHFPDDMEPGYGDGMTWMVVLVRLIRWESELADAILHNADGAYNVSEDTYWRSLLSGMSTDFASGMRFTRDTWLQFRTEGQKFLKLVPRLEELKRYNM